MLCASAATINASNSASAMFAMFETRLAPCAIPRAMTCQRLKGAHLAHREAHPQAQVLAPEEHELNMF